MHLACSRNGKLVPTDNWGGDCELNAAMEWVPAGGTDPSKCSGGMIKLIRFVEHLRNTSTHLLLLDAGSFHWVVWMDGCTRLMLPPPAYSCSFMYF